MSRGWVRKSRVGLVALLSGLGAGRSALAEQQPAPFDEQAIEAFAAVRARVVSSTTPERFFIRVGERDLNQWELEQLAAAERCETPDPALRAFYDPVLARTPLGIGFGTVLTAVSAGFAVWQWLERWELRALPESCYFWRGPLCDDALAGRDSAQSAATARATALTITAAVLLLASIAYGVFFDPLPALDEPLYPRDAIEVRVAQYNAAVQKRLGFGW